MDPRKKTPPSGAGSNEGLRLDPGDVRRYARLMRERQRVGPLGRLLRYVIVVLVLAGGAAAYWNFDTLRGMTVNFPDLAALVRHDAGSGPASASGETGTAVVEATGVAGVEAPSSLPGSPPPATEHAAPARPAPIRSAAEPPRTEPPETLPAAESAAPAAAPTSAPEPSPATAPTPPPAAAPATPPEPERFSFGLTRIEVSEGAASAAVLVLRGGDMRRPSSVRWWTTDGTAKAGQDYVDLGRVVLKFAAGEQNRAIHVPIIGDKIKEGPENFYVNLAWGEDEGPIEKVEVVIVDDD